MRSGIPCLIPRWGRLGGPFAECGVEQLFFLDVDRTRGSTRIMGPHNASQPLLTRREAEGARNGCSRSLHAESACAMMMKPASPIVFPKNVDRQHLQHVHINADRGCGEVRTQRLHL